MPSKGEAVLRVTVLAEQLGYTVFEPMEAGAANHPLLVEAGQYRLLMCFSECNCFTNVTIAVA